jgi:sodium/potassium-transporting ATPase subunit alpha
MFNYSECRVQQISPITNRPVCFTTEAAKYGQSSYFYSNVIGQVMNNFVLKTRRESIFKQGMNNMFLYFGLTQ